MASSGVTSPYNHRAASVAVVRAGHSHARAYAAGCPDTHPDIVENRP